ncbi:MAG: hypothetical protein AAF699_03340 [Pseudomonadota bacterium]
MSTSILRLLTIVAIASVTAAAQSDEGSAKSPAQLERDARIKSTLARKQGEITALEPDDRSGGVFIGFSSGAVVRCQAEGACLVLEGTPQSAVAGAVRGLALSAAPDKRVLWVSYPFGVLYRCIDDVCGQIKLPAEVSP